MHGICAKLNVTKSAQAVIVAYRRGWLDEHAENQVSVQVRHLAEATAELTALLRRRRRRLSPALQHYLASFDDLLLAQDDAARGAARVRMEEALARVLPEAGMRRNRNHGEALAELLDRLITRSAL